MTLAQQRQRLAVALTDDLRNPEWRGDPNPLAGHCYVAVEAIYHLSGGVASGLVPQVITHNGRTHWYLKHRQTGAIIDPTANQFVEPVPYHLGRGCGFLTKQPSKRASIVIARVKDK